MAGGGIFRAWPPGGRVHQPTGVGDLLYVYQHMTLKGACVAVVEGHGGIIANWLTPSAYATSLSTSLG